VFTQNFKASSRIVVPLCRTRKRGDEASGHTVFQCHDHDGNEDVASASCDRPRVRLVEVALRRVRSIGVQPQRSNVTAVSQTST
jgi:hypothetical protein